MTCERCEVLGSTTQCRQHPAATEMRIGGGTRRPGLAEGFCRFPGVIPGGGVGPMGIASVLPDLRFPVLV